MTVHIIAAVEQGGGIGRGGDMLHHLRADLQRFRRLTMGHTLIMGRRTFESLPGGALPGRRNIVVTRNAAFTAPDIETASSLEQALAMAAADSDVYIIGGGVIYEQAMSVADVLDITHIMTHSADADTFFPDIDNELFELIDSESAPTPVEAVFATYRRRKTPAYDTPAEGSPAAL